MEKKHYTGKFKGSKFNITISVQVFHWDDKNIHFVYAPALDITGYDTNEIAAAESFNIVLNETLNYMQNKNTLFDELERLGWAVNKRKKTMHAPVIEDLLNDNEQFKSIYDKGAFKVEEKEVKFAIA